MVAASFIVLPDWMSFFHTLSGISPLTFQLPSLSSFVIFFFSIFGESVSNRGWVHISRSPALLIPLRSRENWDLIPLFFWMLVNPLISSPPFLKISPPECPPTKSPLDRPCIFGNPGLRSPSVPPCSLGQAPDTGVASPFSPQRLLSALLLLERLSIPASGLRKIGL